MGRVASPETQLRVARADIRRLSAELQQVSKQMGVYRVRATLAEQEVAEWKKRFDALLNVPGVQEKKR